MLAKIYVGLVLFWGLGGTVSFAAPIRIACIDCYSSASLYPAVATRIAPGTNIEWILVQTHPYSDGQRQYLYGFPAGSRHLKYDSREKGWLDQVERDLKNLGVTGLLEGMDEGSYQAPLICERMGFPTNSVEMRGARKHKDEQMEIAGKFGIPTLALSDVDKAIRWINTFPHEELVVKFNDGVSGIGMKDFSKSDPDLRAKLQAMLDGPKMGPFGKEDFFIVQPRIRGRKFFINTYSFEGRSVVTGLSEYNMIEANGTTLYFLDAFLGLDSKEARILEPAANWINERMQVVRGPAHVEFILDDATGQIFLLENNVRIAGAGVPAMETRVYGIGQLELHLLSILDPARLRVEMAKYPRGRSVGGMIVVLPNAHAGHLLTSGVREVESLSTYYSPGPQYRIKPESRVAMTVDQNTATLMHFVGPREALQADVARLVKMVREERFVKPDLESYCPNRLAKLGGILERRMQTMDWNSLPN